MAAASVSKPLPSDVCDAVILSRQPQLVPMFVCVFLAPQDGVGEGLTVGQFLLCCLSECVHVCACVHVCVHVCKCMCVHVCDSVKAIPACPHVLCVFFLFLRIG